MKPNLHYGQQHDRFISLSLRSLQLTTCVVALVLMACSFKAHQVTFLTDNGDSQEVTVYYGGPAVTFVMLVAFTACLYDVFFLVLVLTLRCVTVPPLWTFGVDALFTMLFMSAGCALAACDYVRYCEALASIVHCALVASSAALCFMAFVGFLMSVAWGAWMRNVWVTPGQKAPMEDHMGTRPSVLPRDLVLGDGEFGLDRATTSYNTYAPDGYRAS